MIRNPASGAYGLYWQEQNPKIRKRRNLRTFPTPAAAEWHERDLPFFNRRRRRVLAARRPRS